MITKENLSQEVFDLYDDFAHSRIDRNTFLEKIGVFAVGSVTVPALLSFLMPDYATRIQVDPKDPRLKTDYVYYDSPKGGGKMKALLSMPVSIDKPLGGVVVVHENRGLNPYIEDVCRRAALAGFVAMAPDALTPLGGYPGTDDEGRTLQAKRDRNEMLEDFIAAAAFVKNHPQCNAKVGVVGFCFGGWVSNMMAVNMPDLAAAVPYYGSAPAIEAVSKIAAPLQIHLASLDTRVNESWPAYEVALKAHNKPYTMHMYDGVNHGFHNDSTPRFDKSAAELAWGRTIAFFKEKLI